MTQNEFDLLKKIQHQPNHWPDLIEIANLLAYGFIDRKPDAKFYITSAGLQALRNHI